MLLLIKYTLLYGIVLMLVALGGMFSEHSGIINIALEGIMVIGGVAGVLTLTMLPASLSPFLVVLISILVAALAGVVYSLLLAFASINLKADQTIGGTALNLLATAIAVVISKYFSESGSAKLNYSNKPFLFSIGGLELSIFVPLGIILLIISYVVLYKTRFCCACVPFCGVAILTEIWYDVPTYRKGELLCFICCLRCLRRRSSRSIS